MTPPHWPWPMSRSRLPARLDAARVASDIVLLGRDLAPLPLALTTARAATRRIRENFRIATLYNILAVPLAVAGLATR